MRPGFVEWGGTRMAMLAAAYALPIRSNKPSMVAWDTLEPDWRQRRDREVIVITGSRVVSPCQAVHDSVGMTATPAGGLALASRIWERARCKGVPLRDSRPEGKELLRRSEIEEAVGLQLRDQGSRKKANCASAIVG